MNGDGRVQFVCRYSYNPLIFRQLFELSSSTYTYILADAKSK
jgi:hypothetical protein